jgi:hypothetical protein
LLSWTRTLNIDDAHSLLARVEPGVPASVWAAACHRELPHLSVARRRELVRIVRDELLAIDDQGRLAESNFLRFYRNAPASAQVDLLDLAWALSHPLPLLVADRLLAPARAGSGPQEIPIGAVEDVVRGALSTASVASVHKTRTVVVGALERVGALRTRGTGRNRTLWASNGQPHPLAFGWAAHVGVDDGSGATTVGARLTGCTPEHAASCLAWCLDRGVLVRRGAELAFGHIAARDVGGTRPVAGPAA